MSNSGSDAHPQHTTITRQRSSTSLFDCGENARSAKRVQLNSSYHSWEAIFAESSLHRFTNPSYQGQLNSNSSRMTNNSNNPMRSPSNNYPSSERQPLRIDTSFSAAQNYADLSTSSSSGGAYNFVPAHNENEATSLNWSVSRPLSAPLHSEDWISQRSPLAELAPQNIDSGSSLYDYSRLLRGQQDGTSNRLKTVRSDPSLRASARSSSGLATPDDGGLRTPIGGLPKQAAGRNDANVYDIGKSRCSQRR